MVVSVQSARPSLWYCLIRERLWSTWRVGVTPSVITRVRKREGVFGEDPAIEDQVDLVWATEVQVLADDVLGERPP
jgi:hypothetical protein